MPSTTMPPVFGSIKSWTQDPHAGDKFWQNTGQDPELKGIDTTNWYPIWKQPNDVTQGYINQIDPNKTTGGFSGVDYGYFTDMLKNMMATGDPNQAFYRQQAQGDVNTSYNKQGQTLKENLAGSGMLRSGVGQNAMASLDAGRSSALGQVDLGLAMQDTSFRQNALKNLLGLQSLGLQEQQGNRSYLESLMGLQNNQYQFGKTLDYQQSQDQFNFFRDMLPGLLQGGASVGAAALSDKRAKKNIEYVGMSEEGIPIVEFNYINGDENRYRGVLAQDVERVKPNAVIEINGTKLVDYSQLSVNMEKVNA